MRWVLLFCLAAWSIGHASAQEPNIKHADWSPGGNLIAFAADFDGAGDIYIAHINGSGVRRLTFDAAMDSYPRFSPDGRTIVFLSRRHAEFSMHFVTLKDGGEEDFLGAQGNLEPAFSPDGRRVVFRSFSPGNAEIMIANANGSALKRLTDNQVEDGFPSFSRDGNSIFFHRTIGGHNQIMMMDLATGGETQLTAGDFNSWHAHQSPDGRSIVYDAEPGGDRDIYVMDLGARKSERLTDTPGRDGYPKWSPDGKQIAFHSARDGGTRIYLMDADGGNQRPFELIR